jgi:anti-sigma regulatory factor (Ser/Thr protein kinase)
VSDPERPADGADADGLVVPSAPRSVGLVRRYAVTRCVALGRGDAADTVALLVSELATNAVLHAYAAQVSVRVLTWNGVLRVEVFDGSPVLPVQRHARAGAEDGRGLALVEALALRWGVDTQPGGKRIWFEVG